VSYDSGEELEWLKRLEATPAVDPGAVAAATIAELGEVAAAVVAQTAAAAAAAATAAHARCEAGGASGVDLARARSSALGGGQGLPSGALGSKGWARPVPQRRNPTVQSKPPPTAPEAGAS
jgi:hypothetical protein